MVKGGNKMKRVLKFIGVGLTITLIEYAIYTVLMMLVFGGNAEMAPLATGLSGVVAMVVAFIMHSKITWRERDPGKLGVVKFFAWNVLLVALIRPGLAAFFELPVGLYQFAFMISEAIHLPFTYDFVQSTGIYVLTTAVSMVLNYICYEKIVFGTTVKIEKKQGKEVKVESVRQARKEEKRERKTEQDAEK